MKTASFGSVEPTGIQRRFADANEMLPGSPGVTTGSVPVIVISPPDTLTTPCKLSIGLVSCKNRFVPGKSPNGSGPWLLRNVPVARR